MKNIILAILVLGGMNFNVNAAELEAKAVADLTADLQATKFKYKETALVFGFNTIKSCLFTSEKFVVLKNYCFPEKKYPAAGYTIISAKYGMIDLYQEELSTGLIQRDIQITNFPNAIGPYLPESLQPMKISSINKIIEELHFKYGPACWSTNFSRYSEVAEVKCNVNTATVDGYEPWAIETQQITNDINLWSQLLKQLDNQFQN